mmetsp:Transcript_13958/g.55076  ORF Transcript_13958/g.55076 Transcript_13958/m.55076 type:complete len:316 (+) Transcript_13958:38-985(+)
MSETRGLEAKGEADQLLKVRRAKSSHGIPAGLRREAVFAVGGVAISGRLDVAVVVDARDNVLEGTGVGGGPLVESGVDEAQRRLAGVQEGVVDQRKDARRNRTRSRRASDGKEDSIPHDELVPPHCRDVGVSLAVGVPVLRRGEAGAGGKELLDGVVLVGMTLGNVGEAAAGGPANALADANGNLSDRVAGGGHGNGGGTRVGSDWLPASEVGLEADESCGESHDIGAAGGIEGPAGCAGLVRSREVVAHLSHVAPAGVARATDHSEAAETHLHKLKVHPLDVGEAVAALLDVADLRVSVGDGGHQRRVGGVCQG